MWHRRQLVYQRLIGTECGGQADHSGMLVWTLHTNSEGTVLTDCRQMPSRLQDGHLYVPFTLTYLLVFDHRYPIYGYLCVWRQSPISVGCTCREWTKTEMGYRALVCVWIRFESNISNKIWDRVRLQLSRKVNHVARLFRVLEILET